MSSKFNDKVSYQITGNTMTLVYSDGATFVIPRTDARFNKVVRLMNSGKFSREELEEAVGTVKQLLSWGYGRIVEVEGEGIKVDCGGEMFSITPALAEVLSDFVNNGDPVTPFVNFVKRLMKNPSMRSRNYFYDFMTKHGISITDEGMVRGYKAVTRNWRDIYTKKVDNSIGVTVPELPRSEVDDDPEVGCSFGYHFGSINYVRNFAGQDDRIILVDVDPEDIVCVPVDSNQQKVRCTKYTVVGEFTDVLPGYVNRTSVDDVFESMSDKDIEVAIYGLGMRLVPLDDDDCDEDLDCSCPGCGSEICADSNFCMYCGTKL